MYQSYFKIGWRNLLKNKSILSSTLAVWRSAWHAVFLSDFISGMNIAMIVSIPGLRYLPCCGSASDGWRRIQYRSTPGPLGIALKSDFPEIQQSCHIGKIRSNGILQRESLPLSQNKYFRSTTLSLVYLTLS